MEETPFSMMQYSIRHILVQHLDKNILNASALESIKAPHPRHLQTLQKFKKTSILSQGIDRYLAHIVQGDSFYAPVICKHLWGQGIAGILTYL